MTDAEREVNIVNVHPLSEVIAKRLFSIENVPKDEQRRMIQRCVKDACNYHDEAIQRAEQRGREKTFKKIRCEREDDIIVLKISEDYDLSNFKTPCGHLHLVVRVDSLEDIDFERLEDLIKRIKDLRKEADK